MIFVLTGTAQESVNIGNIIAMVNVSSRVERPATSHQAVWDTFPPGIVDIVFLRVTAPVLQELEMVRIYNTKGRMQKKMKMLVPKAIYNYTQTESENTSIIRRKSNHKLEHT